jgi:uncharacterized membrane protein YraQ (UPF0718 family)
MPALTDLLVQSLEKVWLTFQHNWPFLVVSILISVALRLYVKPEHISRFITRYRRVGIYGATAAAVATPLCSCGTTAIVLGMIASTVPWAPIVAFMVASPLTSPEELVYSAGLFGWPFAIAFFVSSILLGLMGGFLAELIESRGWLANQTRFSRPAAPVISAAEHKIALPVTAAPACACTASLPQSAPAFQSRDLRATRPMRVAAPIAVQAACCGPVPALAAADCGCSSAAVVELPQACGCGNSQAIEARPTQDPKPRDEKQAITLRTWIEEIYHTGRQLLPMFLGFAFIGYLLNGLIPQAWVAALFGKGNVYSVPLAATLGLPFYFNTEGSLPLIRGLIDGGMSQGAALAFLITGAGTSIGAVAGALTIARWRVIGLVVATLWVGAVVLGFTYNALLALRLF